MSSQTKILVLHRRIFLYTLLTVFILAVIAVIFFLSVRNTAKEQYHTAASFYEADEITADSASASTTVTTYLPGIYQSCVRLGDSQFEISLCVDSDHINSITLLPVDDTISTMYPLLNSTVDELTGKILETQSLDNISYSTEYRYTCLTILSAIQQALDKAK